MGIASGALVSSSSRQADRPIRLGGAIVGAARHICAFFNSIEEHDRVLLPFIQEGFERGETAVHIVDPRRRGEHVERLRSIGIDATAAQHVGHLDLRDWPGVDGLLEYEASANLAHSEDAVVCAHDLARVRGDLVVDVMRTHPMIIIDGILQENPFFVAPERFLRELRERRRA